MKLTDAQHRNLEWLMDHEGRGYLRGDYLHNGEDKSPGASIVWLHLMVKGLVSGSDGEVRITDYGRRVLNPLAPQPVEAMR